MDISHVVKSTQEQATAAWVDHLNQLRLNELIANLKAQDINLAGALETLEAFKLDVSGVVESNRGGVKGMHGFIAERAQVAIENARKIIEGANPEYFLIDDNGPVDYLFGDTQVQQKFVQYTLGLGAIKEHLEKYPDFLKNGGTYQIPKDYYEKLQDILSISPEEATRLTKNSEPSITLWRNIHKIIKEIGVDPQNFPIEPTAVKYSEVQMGTYEATADREAEVIKDTDQEHRNAAYQKSRPTLQEGVRVTAAAAAIEGGMSFCLGVAQKLKSGKKLPEFTAEDWKDVGIEATVGGGKGAVRGASIYGLTNFTATPAAVASALVTATFGVLAQKRLLQQGKISNEDFIVNSEVICLDVTVSAISSLMGQAMIPIPVLGAVVGNVAGMFMYSIAKSNLSMQEQVLVERYRGSIQLLNEQLDAHYLELIELLKQEFSKFSSALELAFDLTVNVAFAGSIALAQYVGCNEEEILMDKQAIDAFFLD